jgi:DNA-binding NarL/FixJ family response regulator
MNNLRILVADDHEVVRRGMVSILKAQAAWEVCAEVSNGREAVIKTKELKPDIAILDIGMPMLNGLEATRQISRNNPNTRVLILTITDADEVVRTVLDAGARGFLLKSDAAQDLIAAVEALRDGRTFFTSRVGKIVLAGYLGQTSPSSLPESSVRSLTAREREIVQLLVEGNSTKEVACQLNLSVKTAETHRSNIMRKLGLHSMSELVLYAVRNNIIQVTMETDLVVPPALLTNKGEGLRSDSARARLIQLSPSEIEPTALEDSQLEDGIECSWL